jgi:hypothetical protein
LGSPTDAAVSVSVTGAFSPTSGTCGNAPTALTLGRKTAWLSSPSLTTAARLHLPGWSNGTVEI